VAGGCGRGDGDHAGSQQEPEAWSALEALGATGLVPEFLDWADVEQGYLPSEDSYLASGERTWCRDLAFLMPTRKVN
jgi:hypothetical protein